MLAEAEAEAMAEYGTGEGAGVIVTARENWHPGIVGLIAALAAQGLALYDAARLGAWLMGRAAECALFSGHESAETLRPTALLDALADAPHVGYVGLLGPAPRRDRLLQMLGPKAARLGGRLHAPVGLDIGARTPEAIALAAAGELGDRFGPLQWAGLLMSFAGMVIAFGLPTPAADARRRSHHREGVRLLARPQREVLGHVGEPADGARLAHAVTGCDRTNAAMRGTSASRSSSST